VPVDDARLSTVLGRPVMAHREAIGIALSGGLAVEGKLAYLL
jgi:hypothetical protein